MQSGPAARPSPSATKRSDLEKAGIKVIQIDEAALRESRRSGRPTGTRSASDWAIPAFRLRTPPSKPTTQIHTRTCATRSFNDIISDIGAMDAPSRDSPSKSLPWRPRGARHAIHDANF